MRLAALVLALSLLAAPAALAASEDFRRVYDDFERDGRIDGCRYSDRELRRAAADTPPDVDQYAPDFAEQLDAARELRASGGCDDREGVGAPGASGGPPAPEPPGRELLPASVPAPAVDVSGDERGGSAPAAVWLLVALAALAALGGIGSLVAWLFGWSPERWTRPLAAAAAEAGDRSADLAADLRDRLRPRR